jgi:hypothetical protein
MNGYSQIIFFLGELNGLSCMCYWKCFLAQKVQGEGLHHCWPRIWYNGLKTSFKKTKHDPDLWMVDKTSYYEHLGAYVDNILNWSKDPMAFIKSLEKIHLLKKAFLSII